MGDCGGRSEWQEGDGYSLPTSPSLPVGRNQERHPPTPWGRASRDAVVSGTSEPNLDFTIKHSQSENFPHPPFFCKTTNLFSPFLTTPSDRKVGGLYSLSLTPLHFLLHTIRPEARYLPLAPPTSGVGAKLPSLLGYPHLPTHLRRAQCLWH